MLQIYFNFQFLTILNYGESFVMYANLSKLFLFQGYTYRSEEIQKFIFELNHIPYAF